MDRRRKREDEDDKRKRKQASESVPQGCRRISEKEMHRYDTSVHPICKLCGLIFEKESMWKYHIQEDPYHKKQVEIASQRINPTVRSKASNDLSNDLLKPKKVEIASHRINPTVRSNDLLKPKMVEIASQRINPAVRFNKKAKSDIIKLPPNIMEAHQDIVELDKEFQADNVIQMHLDKGKKYWESEIEALKKCLIAKKEDLKANPVKRIMPWDVIGSSSSDSSESSS